MVTQFVVVTLRDRSERIFGFPSNAVCNPSTLDMTWLWESSATVAVIEALALPSNEADPVTSPVKEIVLAVASFVAVAAFPEQDAAVVAFATADVILPPI
jgi:hypothetical protein